ncbi:MAG: glutamine--tRNA ligase/YqeY domain fusion protein [Gammaproteobacteria bacterium]|nr:glutamine--tRNA ligase/YqeY domain fusion protein [Gammaproteobacteria bacterium]NIR84211.1 glutamine--tRNA ligase/YqeY domain fusion protein [Gammaproteobacteria bacterium]NIR89681.1 glutamine--tRNA ligase/YqeY domain fusion protein [Gammaproteobacteria bacterium]NIU05369.1 glutamine--tRNA ligase/YqeY domain fusion protein [Gammaproteobacteria bacterium]NIV52315.1 glutamine--tRNA ligase/YqeY domain fusion protein [Gammaproteobacteria bacterium]
MPTDQHTSERTAPTNFIRQIIADDLRTGRIERVVTRFPPEPNGYLHIGHAKSICLNFGIAGEHLEGVCYLRFDDTNPLRESVEYERSIQEDVRWLGFDWGEHLLHASDYFDELHAYAVELIEAGKAYVDSLSQEQIREHRGTPWEPGKDSPYRTRSIEENLNLFERMRAGAFEDGAHVLRAKIDMASPNLHLRDPIIYRIRRFPHHRTGNKWCIYPMYDFTQCLSDAIESVTHSLCTLEFEDNRALYDWFLDQLDTPSRPKQIEFARLNLNYTVMSKRKLNELVAEGHVEGWDDPRLPTIVGLRRRGYTPASIRDFCERIGVTRTDTTIDMGVLENCVREDLNRRAPRAMAVLRPLRVVIENYPQGKVEWFDAPNHPADPSMGTRAVPFSRVLYIEREDFMEDPPKKFFRLAPGREVRLRYAYLIRCAEVVRDEHSGAPVELRCIYDPDSRGGAAPDGRKVKGTLHWVSAEHALIAEVRLYDRLFRVPRPGRDVADFKQDLNPESLQILTECRLESSLANARPGTCYQFERQGYFCADRREGREHLVFNRTVTLRDTWAKITAAERPKE